MENGRFGMVEDLNHSILAVIGSGIAWLFTPLGWGNWQSAVATITGLIAKENVVEMCIRDRIFPAFTPCRPTP